MTANRGSAMVSPDNPVAQIGGVTVDFKGNLSEEAKLTIQADSQRPDSEEYTGLDVYDFTLEGQSEFITLIDITLPNTAGPDEAFHVVYHNEQTGQWEKLPYEIEGDKVRFSTTHFSKYGLLKYIRNRYIGPTTRLEINYPELNKALMGIQDNDLFERFLEQKGQMGSDEFTNNGLAVTNDIISIWNVPPTLMGMFGDPVAKELSNFLTVIGGAVTILKVAYQWQAQDSVDKIVYDNVFNVCQLALGGTAMAIPSSWILPAAGLIVFGIGYYYQHEYAPSINPKDES